MESLITLLAEPAGAFGRTVITLGHVALAAVAVLLGAGLLAWRRGARRSAEAAAQAAEQQRLLADLMKAQGEMQGRMATLAEVFGSRQAELNQSIRERLDGRHTNVNRAIPAHTLFAP